MTPQECALVLARIQDLYGKRPQFECDLLLRRLEQLPYPAVMAALERYAFVSTSFDRIEFVNIVQEEYRRALPAVSLAAVWKKAKVEDNKLLEEKFGRLSESELSAAEGKARDSQPDIFKRLQRKPRETDLGRALLSPFL